MAKLIKKHVLAILRQTRLRPGMVCQIGEGGEWFLQAFQVRSRGVGAAWHWNYEVRHHEHHPHGVHLDSADEAARCVVGLGHWGLRRPCGCHVCAAMRAKAEGDIPTAPLSTEALDAYDKLCREAHEATSCMQCGTATDEREGLLCTPCAVQDVEANDEHERDHMPGRV